MNKALLILLFCLSVLFSCSIATADANHAFYPLPHQERGSFVAAEKIIRNTNSGLWFVDVQGSLIFYNGSRLNNAVDEAGETITGVTDAVMLEQELWLVKDGLAYCYSPTTTELHRLDMSSTPFRFVESQGQEIWFANSRGLYAVIDRQQQPEFFPFPKSFSITGLYGAGGSIFVAGEQGVYEFRNRQFIELLLYPGQKVTTVFEDSQHQLWFGTLNGLYLSRRERVFVPAQNTLRNNSSVSAIAETESGMWIGTPRGLNHIDKQSLKVTHYSADADGEYSINGNRIMALLRDEKDGLWIATNSGINYLPTSTAALRQVPYNQDTGLIPPSQINQLQQLDGGSIWLATDDGLIEFEDNLNIVRRLPVTGGVNHFVYKEGTFWLATDSGLKAYSLESSEWLAQRLPAWFQNQPITSLMIDRYNSVWIGMQSHLYRYWPDTEELNAFGSHWFQAPHGSESVTILFEDSHHQVWVGTDYGLYRFSAGLLNIVDETAHQGGVIDIFEDILGQLWVVNSHGLQYSSKLTSLQLKSVALNGAYAKPYCVVGDNGGSWVATSRGLSYYSLSAKMKLHLPPLVGGFEKEPFSPVCEILKSGKLLLSGRKGLLEIDPKILLTSDTQMFSIVVGDIQVDNRLERVAGANAQLLSVPYGSSVSFNVGVLPFSGLAKVQYRLKGHSKEGWKPLSSPILYLDNLAPGEYQLELQFDDVNLQGQPEISYAFRVSNLWLLPHWSTSLPVVLFVTFLLSFIVWRARVYQRQNLSLKQSVFRQTARIELNKKQLYASNKHLQRILHMRQKFMAQLYHELRIPLSLILGPLKKMQVSSKGGETEQLQLVANNVERSLHLVEQLLTRDAQAFLEPDKPCEQRVSPIIQACCMSWQLEADQKDITLCLEDDTGGLSVLVAPYHLEIMVGNLLSNALKFTSRQGCINVTVKDLNHQLVVSVSDTGKGMSEDVRKNIFNSYFKEGGDFNPEAGFGLGLSTVKQLVEVYAGEISVVSYQGIGSEFILYLPLYREGCVRTLAGEGKTRIVTPEDLPKLLVASIDEEVVSCLGALLQNYPLITACDGYEAVILAKENQPDIILCDLMLPGLDGLQVRERLQEEPRECHAVFVLMIENSSQGHVAADIDSVLTKPFEPDTVLNHIQLLLHDERPQLRQTNCGKGEVAKA